MTDLAYKYTDEDLRRDPNLFEIAAEFLRHYQGDFEFLRAARGSQLIGEPLSPGVVRGILNCMRTHPIGVQMLPQTPTGRFVHHQAPAIQIMHSSVWPPDYLKPVEMARPARVFMRCRFKALYILSTHPQAFRAHLLDQTKSEVIWFPHVGELKVRPDSYCSVRLGFGVMSLEAHGRNICRQCQRIKESRAQ